MIEIIKGSYGMKVNGFIVPVTEKDGPISLDKEKEERLVRLKVAKYVDANETAEGSAVAGTDDHKLEDQTETAGADETDSDSVDEELPAYSEDMKLDELKAVAEKYGVDASKARSKKEVIAAIEAAKELPALSAAELE